jgi:FAD/FMN-containing dehydrogenase
MLLAEPTPASTTGDLAGRLATIVGADNVVSQADDLEFYSTDIYRQRKIAELVVRPASAEQVSVAVKVCTDNDRAVTPRGGGLSYTNGYTPIRDRTVIFDLCRLDKIIEINAEDNFVTVECAVTWRQLYEALHAKGLRTPYFGTASGFSSTIGGAMSQHSSHFGSAQFGISAESCLGLEVVLADGSIIKTGSASSKYRPSPFFRNYGPDLTGLFLGDTGALGFKTKVTLKTIPFPQCQRYGAFAFDTHDQLIAAMGEVGRDGLAAECGGWDPKMVANYISQNPALQEDLKYLAGVVRSGSSLLDGLKGAARIALTGRNAFKGVYYLMNVTIDEFSAAAGDEKLKAVEKVAARHGGRPVEPTFPRAHRGTPFNYPNSVLGAKGQRWVPTHGLTPHSRALEVSHAMFDYFDRRADEMERHGIEWRLIMSEIGNSATLIEPMFYWPDKRNIFHERWIQKDVLAGMQQYPSSPETAEAMHSIRIGLLDIFMRHGCTHFQVGKIYPYKQGREENTYALLEGIKKLVDPKGLMNPGSLGLAQPG